MLPQSQARKPRNSSKVNLIISLTFHGFLVFAILYFAAREGILGKDLQTMTVNMVKKDKPPEVKPKEPEKPPDVPKDEPKIAMARVTAPEPSTAPAPSALAPASAPAAVDMPSFEFDGGRQVITADPVTIYKGLIENALTARWQRPDMSDKDKDYVADVEVTVDSSGRLSHPVITKASGNQFWDDSVKRALAETTQLTEAPPKGFPSKVTVRFDIAEDKTQSIMP